MEEAIIYSALGTPLLEQEGLCVEGLAAHMEDHARAGIERLLVGGTMGAMQLLTGDVYGQLLCHSVQLWRARGELLVGVGDLSFSRTCERIRMANELQVDGVVALTPFFLSYSQSELVEYFEALAAESSHPLYLYDLPQRTGIGLTLETVERLARHPNIAGIKCSGDVGQTRRLIDAVDGSEFRVIVAQAPLTDVLIRSGVRRFVDGVYCLAPRVVRSIVDAAAKGDWDAAARHTRLINDLLGVLGKYGVFSAATALLNARGIPGNFAPLPHRPLSQEDRRRFLAEPATQALLAAA